MRSANLGMIKILHLLVVSNILFAHLTNSAPTRPSDEYASIIEKAAASLTDADLADDSLVLQQVVSNHSIYRHDKTEKHGAPIFIRNEDDTGKSVIVFREGEDFLPICNKKRTFVVLKQVGAEKNQYRIFFAYVKSSPTDSAAPVTIEWDVWYPRDNRHNKALHFGSITCRKSSLVPCKKELQVATDDSPDYEDFPSISPAGDKSEGTMPPLPYKHPAPKINQDGGPDYWCDLIDPTTSEKRFMGAVIGALTQAVAVLTGAQIVYKDEEEMVKAVDDEIKKAALAQKGKGRSMGGGSANASAEAAQKLVNMGRSTVAGGTLLFYTSVVKLGALAIGEVAPGDLAPGVINDDKLDDLTQGFKGIGMNILRSLFRGVDFDDAEQKGVTPNPHELLNENVVASLVEGRSVGQAIAENSAQGRGMFHWLLGGADVGTSSSNGEQAIRQYKGVQKDGSVTGSKGVDNLNFAIDNAFGGSKKSAGQIFSENIVAGVYMPYGLVEDVADALGGSILGVGKTSADRSYVDDILDKAMNVVAGAGGQIVDVVGDILGPIGLGGLWNGVAGVGGAALGAVGAGLAIGFPLSAPVVGGYHLVKLGAKALGLGGVIGMLGAQSRAENEGGNQNVNRDDPPQLGPTYGEIVGRRRKRDATSIVNKHLATQGITDVDLFTHLGWKTVDVKQEDLSKAVFNQDEPFLGFGKCNNVGTTVKDFQTVKSGKEAAKLYFNTMRTSCLPDQLDAFNDLITEGVVKFNAEDKTFNIPDGHKLLTKPKLSHSETHALAKAFEMSIYSKNYMSCSKKPLPKEGTRNADTLTSMVLLFLEEAAKRAPMHYNMLTRNVAKLVKIGFTKSLQDFYRYKYCRKCAKQPLQETLHDCVQFSALLEFVVKEQDHPGYKELSKEEAFKKHFDWTAEGTTEKLSMYFI